MKKIFILALLFTFSFSQIDVFGQSDMKEDEAKGQIIVKGKKTEDGVIQLASINSPWENQRTVRYVTEKKYAKGKLKKKDWDKYKTKDIEGYVFGDRKFVVEKYTPIGAIVNSASVNKLTAATSMASSLSKNQHFMELLMDGDIKVYRFYNYPPEASAQAGDAQINAYQEMVESLRNNYEILIKTSDKKAKVQNFKKIKLTELLADCEAVKTKYENGEYQLKKKVMNQLLKTNGGPQLESDVLEIIGEYNECKKSK